MDDFIRGTQLMNVTLKPKDIAISTVATSCLLSMWRVIDPFLIQPDLCKAAKYEVPLIDLPDCLPKFSGWSAYLQLHSGRLVPYMYGNHPGLRAVISPFGCLQ